MRKLWPAKVGVPGSTVCQVWRSSLHAKGVAPFDANEWPPTLLRGGAPWCLPTKPDPQLPEAEHGLSGMLL